MKYTLDLYTNVLHNGNSFGSQPSNIAVPAAPYAISVDPTTGEVYVTNLGTNEVSVISASFNQVIASIPVGKSPEGVAYNPSNNMMYVTNAGSDNMSVIYLPSKKVVYTIDGLSSPQGVAYCPTNSYMYVSDNNSNQVSVVNPNLNTIIMNVSVGSHPRGVAYDPANALMYVSNFGSSNVSVINCTTNHVVQSVNVAFEPWEIAYDGYNGNMYVTTNPQATSTLYMINSTTNRSSALFPYGNSQAPSEMTALCYDPINHYMYASIKGGFAVAAFNSSTNAVDGQIRVYGQPEGIAYDPANHDLYVAGPVDDTIHIVSTVIYLVILRETGLESGTVWSLAFYGAGDWPYDATYWTTNSTITFTEENGNYTYSIGGNSAYYTPISNGIIKVDGSSLVVTFQFNARYTVTFNESGLPFGFPWYVNLDGVNKTVNGSYVGFTVGNGSFFFRAAPITRQTHSVISGTIEVNGTPMDRMLSFHLSQLEQNNILLLKEIFLGLTLGTILILATLFVYLTRKRRRV